MFGDPVSCWLILRWKEDCEMVGENIVRGWVDVTKNVDRSGRTSLHTITGEWGISRMLTKMACDENRLALLVQN